MVINPQKSSEFDIVISCACLEKLGPSPLNQELGSLQGNQMFSNVLNSASHGWLGMPKYYLSVKS